jgi:hypothetical protein
MKSGRQNVFCVGDLLQYNKSGRVVLAVDNSGQKGGPFDCCPLSG